MTQNFVNDDAGGWGVPLMDSNYAFISGPDGTPLEQVALTDGTVNYLVTDSAGSVRGIVASSTGNLTASTSYDAFGNPQTPAVTSAGVKYPGMTLNTPLGFQGAYTDGSDLILLLDGTYVDPSTDILLNSASIQGGNAGHATYSVSRRKTVHGVSAAGHHFKCEVGAKAGYRNGYLFARSSLKCGTEFDETAGLYQLIFKCKHSHGNSCEGGHRGFKVVYWSACAYVNPMGEAMSANKAPCRFDTPSKGMPPKPQHYGGWPPAKNETSWIANRYRVPSGELWGVATRWYGTFSDGSGYGGWTNRKTGVDATIKT